MSFVQICFLWILTVQSSIDCNSTFEYKTSHAKGNSRHSIELTLKDGLSDEYLFELHDLNTGSLVKSVKVFFAANQSIVVFENIPASSYTIYFSSDRCVKKKSLKGRGIILQ
jgi:hypothetical protein